MAAVLWRFLKGIGFIVAGALAWLLGLRLMGLENHVGRGEIGLGLLFGGGLALIIFGLLAFVNRLPRIPEDWPG